jgi:hypothetical protein
MMGTKGVSMDRTNLIFFGLIIANFFFFVSVASSSTIEAVAEIEDAEEVYLEESEAEESTEEAEESENFISDIKTYSDNFSTENVGEALPYAKLEAVMDEFKRSPALAPDAEEDESTDSEENRVEIDTEE